MLDASVTSIATGMVSLAPLISTLTVRRSETDVGIPKRLSKTIVPSPVNSNGAADNFVASKVYFCSIVTVSAVCLMIR